MVVQGASHEAPGKSGLHAHGEGERKKREVSKHQETLSLLSLWQALKPQRAT